MIKSLSFAKFFNAPAIFVLFFPLYMLVINDVQSEWRHFENTLLQYGVLAIVVIPLLFIVFRRSEKYEIRLSLIDMAFILFSAYLLLNMRVDLFTMWAEKTLRTFFLLILFILFQTVFRKSQRENMLWSIILILGITNSLCGFVQFYENYSSNGRSMAITGTFNNSAAFSCYAATTLPAFYYFLIANGKRKLKTYILIFIIGCVFLLLLVALSRAAVLSAIIGAIYMINKKYNFVSIRKLLLFAVPIVIVALSLILYFLRTDSADGRLLIWRVSMTMWEDNPITGIGTGRFAYRYNDYQADFFENHKSAFEMLASNTYYAFNEYIETLVEGGIIGLLLFIFLTVTVFYKIQSLSEPDISLVCCQTGILTVLVFGLFSYPFSSTAIYSLFIAYLSFLSCYSKPIFNFRVKRNLLNVFTFVFLAVLLWLGIIGVERYSAIKEWKKASNMVSHGNVEKGLDIYSKIYPVLKDHGAFLFNYGAELSESERYDESIAILKQASKYFNHIDLYIFLGRNYEKLADYENAKKCYQYASLMIPNRFVPKYLLAKLYMLKGDCLQAGIVANEIIAMPVKVDSRTVSLIKKEMQIFLQNQPSHYEGC